MSRVSRTVARERQDPTTAPPQHRLPVAQLVARLAEPLVEDAQEKPVGLVGVPLVELLQVLGEVQVLPELAP